jgi:hypothetical protein
MRYVYNNSKWQKMCNIWEDFYNNYEQQLSNIDLKKQAVNYLGFENRKRLNKHEVKLILSKTHKIKNSYKKEERARLTDLLKELQNI